jgi:hypothetical protein
MMILTNSIEKKYVPKVSMTEIYLYILYGAETDNRSGAPEFIPEVEDDDTNKFNLRK